VQHETKPVQSPPRRLVPVAGQQQDREQNFDSETLTIVASNCAGSAPNGATAQIVQTKGSSFFAALTAPEPS
jgi:hypothetical protein